MRHPFIDPAEASLHAYTLTRLGPSCKMSDMITVNTSKPGRTVILDLAYS